MKKSKVAIAIVLALILVFLCMNVPTFSWFSRPHEQDGEKAVFGGSNGTYSINAYNGKNVTVSTMGSATGVDGTYTTNCNGNNACSGSNVPNNNRKYFCTTLTNNSGTEQNVSLYARTLSIPTASNGTLALGVNGPTRSYRDYSALATPSTDAKRDSMRIYFQKSKNNPPDGWTAANYYICWNEDPDTNHEILDGLGTNGTYYQMTYINESDGYYNYYADIPKTATHAFFAVENWAEGKSVGELTPDNWKKRTQTLWNLAGDGQTQLQSKVYKLTSTVSNGNTLVDTTSSGAPFSVGGACINHYHNTIFVAMGNTYNAALSNTSNLPLRTDHINQTQSNYTANYIGSLRYYSGNTSVFTVNETSGVITPVGAGEATLYTKAVGGSYGDTQEVQTTVNVTSAANYVFNDVPIVKNVKIPASDPNNADANVVKVYWYVINNSPTTALTYTIDNVYIAN